MLGSALAEIQFRLDCLRADTSATTRPITIRIAVRTQRVNCPATAPQIVTTTFIMRTIVGELPHLINMPRLDAYAYDAQERVIEPLLEAGKKVVIPPRSTRKEQRNFDRYLYKARHLIENFFARLKQYRAIATRYDKTARNFLGAIYLAGAMVSLN